VIRIISVALEIHGVRIGSFQARIPKFWTSLQTIKISNKYSRLVIKIKSYTLVNACMYVKECGFPHIYNMLLTKAQYTMIKKDGLNFVRLYFLNYTRYVNDLHNI